MNTSLKWGIALLVTALVLRVGEELVWPSIARIPIGDPLKLPLLTALGVCIVLVPVFLLLGAILTIVGAVNKNR